MPFLFKRIVQQTNVTGLIKKDNTLKTFREKVLYTLQLQMYFSKYAVRVNILMKMQ